jgi:hypothetical protein
MSKERGRHDNWLLLLHGRTPHPHKRNAYRSKRDVLDKAINGKRPNSRTASDVEAFLKALMGGPRPKRTRATALIGDLDAESAAKGGARNLLLTSPRVDGTSRCLSTSLPSPNCYAAQRARAGLLVNLASRSRHGCNGWARPVLALADGNRVAGASTGTRATRKASRGARPSTDSGGSDQQVNARFKELRSVRAWADQNLHLTWLEYRIEVES